MIIWTQTGLAKISEGISRSQLKRVSVSTNINHLFDEKCVNLYNSGSSLYCCVVTGPRPY